jgi:acetyl esterase/lipase
MLDIYFSPYKVRTPKRTIVVFVHGGGWSQGDKSGFPNPLEHAMPAWFVQRGYVFVAVNFRLADNLRSLGASIADMAADIAKALKWLTVNGRRYHGQISEFVLIGYSSGAHLTALVATHQHFLKTCRLTSAILRGVVCLDVPYLDVPLAIHMLEKEDVGLSDPSRRLATLYKLFGVTRSTQERASPAAGLGPWLSQTAFLILSAGRHFGQAHTFTKRMSQHFRDCLSAHGISADHKHGDDWEHAELISRWGGEPAGHVEHFLSRINSNASEAQASTISDRRFGA